MKRMLILLFALALLLTIPITGSRAQDGVPQSRFDRLARGINLPFWFWYAPDDPAARFDPQEFVALRAAGLTYVRVPIDLGFVMDDSDDLLNDDHLALIDQGIAQLHAADLAVIVDLHSTSLEDSDASNYSGALEDPAFVGVFIAFWKSFAAHLSAYDPELTFLGLMNEPVFFENPRQWETIQRQLVEAVRRYAPEHTLIVTAARWSSIDTLLALEPLADPNVVYEFHFYDPFVFTHQGASWTWDAVRPLRGIPYPAAPETVAPLLDQYTGETREALVWYGEERWDRAKIDDRIARAAQWAARREVRLICTEFGVFGPYAPPADRARWIQETRETLESYGIGWAMWEYDEAFGLVVRQADDSVQFDPAIVAALGLTLPATP